MTPIESQPIKDLRWMGPILDCSGYAAAGRGYLRACMEGNINVQARDRSRSLNLKNRGMDDYIITMYDILEKNKVPSNCPTVQHQVPDQFFKNTKASRSIGYTIFEMASIPSGWATHCNNMDVIWTGSSYSKQAFLNGGVKVPIEVLPHAIDVNMFHPSVEPWTISNRRSFAFLSIMDFHDRKAWKETLRAYWTAFKPGDDVCFILKAFFGSFSDEARKDVMTRIYSWKCELGFTETPPVLFYGHDVPMNDMPGLYRAADCYVGISREGFGLPYFEAMACGLPAIGPEVGGTREYMNEDNSFLVKYDRDVPISADMIQLNPTFSGLKWTSHSWEHLSKVMRTVVENTELRKQKALLGNKNVVENFNFKSIGSRIYSLIPDA